jgi:hypothetical protein
VKPVNHCAMQRASGLKTGSYKCDDFENHSSNLFEIRMVSTFALDISYDETKT